MCAPGTVAGKSRILSHLKASEPLVAFQSHEVPLFRERIALNRQLGREHGHTVHKQRVSSPASQRTLENQYWVISSHLWFIFSSGCSLVLGQHSRGQFLAGSPGKTDNRFFNFIKD